MMNNVFTGGKKILSQQFWKYKKKKLDDNHFSSISTPFSLLSYSSHASFSSCIPFQKKIYGQDDVDKRQTFQNQFNGLLNNKST